MFVTPTPLNNVTTGTANGTGTFVANMVFDRSVTFYKPLVHLYQIQEIRDSIHPYFKLFSRLCLQSTSYLVDVIVNGKFSIS